MYFKNRNSHAGRPSVGHTNSFLALTLLAIAFLLPLPAWADTLSWDMPTERVNEQPLDPSDIEYTTLYRNGEHYEDVPAPATEFDIAETCSGGVDWTATVTAAGLESDHSNTYTQAVDEVGCRPKPPAGFGGS